MKQCQASIELITKCNYAFLARVKIDAMDTEHMCEQINALKESFTVKGISKVRGNQEQMTIAPVCLIDQGNPFSLPDGLFEDLLINEQALADELAEQIENESENGILKLLLDDIDDSKGKA